MTWHVGALLTHHVGQVIQLAALRPTPRPGRHASPAEQGGALAGSGMPQQCGVVVAVVRWGVGFGVCVWGVGLRAGGRGRQGRRRVASARAAARPHLLPLLLRELGDRRHVLDARAAARKAVRVAGGRALSS